MDDRDMRRGSRPHVSLSMMATKNGYVAGPAGELDWVGWSPEMDVAALELINRADLIFSGPNAFVDMAVCWPAVFPH